MLVWPSGNSLLKVPRARKSIPRFRQLTSTSPNVCCSSIHRESVSHEEARGRGEPYHQCLRPGVVAACATFVMFRTSKRKTMPNPISRVYGLVCKGVKG